MTNPQLGADELAAAQAQPEVVVNELTRAITRQLAGSVEINFDTDEDIELSVEQALTGLIILTDAEEVLTEPRNVFFPDLDEEIGTEANSRPKFIVLNATFQDVNIGRNTGGNVIIPASESALLMYDGEDVQAVAAAGGGGGGGAAIYELVLRIGEADTEVTVGAKAYIRSPREFVLYPAEEHGITASLLTASSSGAVEIDILKNGTSIFDTFDKLTIDEGEKTSRTAEAPHEAQTSNIDEDDEIVIEVTSAGSGAEGLVVVLRGEL